MAQDEDRALFRRQAPETAFELVPLDDRVGWVTGRWVAGRFERDHVHRDSSRRS